MKRASKTPKPTFRSASLPTRQETEQRISLVLSQPQELRRPFAIPQFKRRFPWNRTGIQNLFARAWGWHFHFWCDGCWQRFREGIARSEDRDVLVASQKSLWSETSPDF